jgi:hypothetical protein
VLITLEISTRVWTAMVTNQEGKSLHDVLQQAVDLVRPEQVHRPPRPLVRVYGLRTCLRRTERADARRARVGRVVCARLRSGAAGACVPEARGEEVVERARLRPLHQNTVRRVSTAMRTWASGRAHALERRDARAEAREARRLDPRVVVGHDVRVPQLLEQSDLRVGHQCEREEGAWAVACLAQDLHEVLVRVADCDLLDSEVAWSDDE